MDPFRIAIVGCGPRGLYCLQSLNEHLRATCAEPFIEITVFEPCEFPGAGNVYSPRQPDFLRMNFAAKYINVWPSVSTDAASEVSGGRVDLVEWFRDRDGLHCADRYIPRAVVGEYLHACFRRVTDSLASRATVTRHGVLASHIERCSSGRWHLQAGQTQHVYDEIAITVGHEGWRESSAPFAASDRKWIPTFPISNLNSEAIPPGSFVAVRGFGLTWIDAALAMTEGRGGRFEQTQRGWTYHRSGAEPARIVPYSRTGRPMLAKPDESRFRQPPELEEVWAMGREQMGALHRPLSRAQLVGPFWQTFIGSAATALRQCAGCESGQMTAGMVDRWFQTWCRNSMRQLEIQRLLRHSVAVAEGNLPPDVSWALGAAWRNLYPAIVTLVSHGGLAYDAWPSFRRIARELERIAFGPPAENLGRILALIDAGVIDLDWITRTPQVDHEGTAVHMISDQRQRLTIDFVVDAVLPGPQQLRAEGPLARLQAAGWLRSSPQAGGIVVNRAGRPIQEDGSSVSGLAVFGRATEGVVLGNDTLSRTLHHHPRRWAAEVIQRATASGKPTLRP